MSLILLCKQVIWSLSENKMKKKACFSLIMIRRLWRCWQSCINGGCSKRGEISKKGVVLSIVLIALLINARSANQPIDDSKSNNMSEAAPALNRGHKAKQSAYPKNQDAGNPGRIKIGEDRHLFYSSGHSLACQTNRKSAKWRDNYTAHRSPKLLAT